MPSTAATARSSSREADVLVAVRVDRLAEELDLLAAGRDQRARLAQDLARRRAALAPARVGDDAEGAELVAAALDRDVADHAVGVAARRDPAPRRSPRDRGACPSTGAAAARAPPT